MRANSGSFGQLAVTGNEIGVEMRFDDVLDFEPVIAGFLQVQLDVPLLKVPAPSLLWPPSQLLHRLRLCSMGRKEAHGV
jgi:hypothetical protein